MKWKGKLISYVIDQLKDDSQWGNTIEKVLLDSSIGIHLAVFNEPFLSLMYEHKKKIESRFSINKISPFEKVRKGDMIILKESGGFVTGVFLAGDVKFYHKITKKTCEQIESTFGKSICTHYDRDFWRKRSRAKYISLIVVRKIRKLPPFKSDKSDRTAWSILREGVTDDLFNQSK